MDFSNIDFQKYADLAVDLVVQYSPKLVTAIIVLFIGLKIIKVIDKVLNKVFGHQHIDPSVAGFLKSLLRIALKVMLFIAVAGMLGVQTTSFIALIGAAGLAVGLSLQGSLANFAGGVLILIFKPFKVGEVIKAQGFIGKVKEIQIVSTTLMTPDNVKIVIPNGDLSNSAIENLTNQKSRRHDLVYGIGYGDDIDHARKVLLKIAKDHKEITMGGNHEPKVMVSNLGDNAVELTLRVWCKTGDFVGLPAQINEQVKKQFDAEGISFPFPQRDIHLYTANDNATKHLD